MEEEEEWLPNMMMINKRTALIYYGGGGGGIGTGGVAIIVAVVVVWATLVLPTTTTTITTAYGQQATGPSQDIEVIDSERVRAQMSSFIGSTRLINYTLFENGNAIYVFEYVAPRQYLLGNSTTNPIQSNILEVHTTHGFTSANGYTFNATGIFTPEGKRLVIETFEPTNRWERER